MRDERIVNDMMEETTNGKKKYGNFIEKFLNDNPELKSKAERLEKYLKEKYKEEYQDLVDIRYCGYSSPVYSLAYEIESKNRDYNRDLEYFEGGYSKDAKKPVFESDEDCLRRVITNNYTRLFHDIEKLEISEEDLANLKERISEDTYRKFTEAIDKFNKRKEKDKEYDKFYLYHTWDINYHNGRYDELCYGEEIKKIKDLMKEYGFRMYEREIDRKTVEDLFTTTYIGSRIE